MPNRMIRDVARTSPTLARLSAGAERTFWRLLLVADDHGRFNADPTVVRSLAFPAHPPKAIRDRDLAKWMGELLAVDTIRLYMVEGRAYGYFPAWGEHQRIRAKSSRFPAPSMNGGQMLADVGRCEQMTTNDPGVGVGDGAGDGAEVEDGDGDGDGAGTPPPRVTFAIPESIARALDQATQLGKSKRLRSPTYWQAAIRAWPRVDFPREILKAEAYLAANPQKHYQNLSRYLHRWFSTAEPEP
jgi:hypothetical protein